MTTATLEAAPEATDTSEAKALRTVRTNMLWAAGAGLLPPALDYAAITLVQVKLLKNLSDQYDTPFSDNLVKNILASLLGGAGALGLSRGFAGRLFKAIPIIGPALGGLNDSLFAAGLTWAVGKVFIQHYESGGTMLTFNPTAMREFFQGALEEGREVAREMVGGK